MNSLAFVLSLLIGSSSFASVRANPPFVSIHRLLESDKVSQKVKAELQIKQNSKLPVLIVMKEQFDIDQLPYGISTKSIGQLVYDALREVALNTQSEVVDILRANSVSSTAYYIRNMIAAKDLSPEVMFQIQQLPQVEKIISNENVKVISAKMKLNDGEPDPSVDGIESSIAAIGANQVWPITKGKGIVVAGQDTGVQWNHPALIDSYRGQNEKSPDHNFNWHDAIKSGGGGNPCGYNTQAPCDDDQHGTHTMGTMVGDDGIGNKIGVAPEAKWISCRNMDKGEGSASTYTECFEFFLAPYPLGGNSMTDGRPDLAPHIINNSWGCPGSEGCAGGEILPILKALQRAGIMVVASAGNDGPSCETIKDQPATHADYALTVGAYDHKNKKIASFSSRGPSALNGLVGPHVVAPGVNIRSSVPGNKYEGAFWSGTSMAGPHVVGAVALLWSARPELVGQIENTRRIVMASAQNLKSTQACGGVSGEAIPNNVFGYGLVNVPAALGM